MKYIVWITAGISLWINFRNDGQFAPSTRYDFKGSLIRWGVILTVLHYAGV